MPLNLHQLSQYPELDYVQLKAALQSYQNIRAKIGQLIKQGHIIRVKKGVYVLGQHLAKQAVNEKILANMIYGPSAISREYALSYYGLIPERVVEVTSVTPTKDKQFATPLARFSYRYLNAKRYALGIQFQQSNDGRQFAIATPEKALADVIVLSKKTTVSKRTVAAYLFDDLRLDPEQLSKIDSALFAEIAAAYTSQYVDVVADYLEQQ